VRFAFIDENRDAYPVDVMCHVLSVSRSGYYEWLSRDTSPRKLDEIRLARVIEDVHRGSRKTYGSPRVARAIKALGETASEGRVARIMRKNGIRAKQARKYRPQTTDSKHSMPVAPNRLERTFNPPAENRAWVADITYVPTREGWLYLACVLDLFSRKVVGWAMNERMPKELALDALAMALASRRPAAGLIAHSDQGCQYASDAYQRLLAAHGALPSMSRKGNCWDNAPMESFFHTLKGEHVSWHDYATQAEAKQSIFEWIEVFYNRQRLHSTIGYRSPETYEAACAA
jgi:transposase InsO family protein